MPSFILGVLGNLLALVLVWVLYIVVVRQHSRTAYLDCCWLPAWRCWRVVIRNMRSKRPLTHIAYRSWLRFYHPASSGSSVRSYDDRPLTEGSRLILPKGQDLPILCFRIEETDVELDLVVTDKFGKERSRARLPDNQNKSLQWEFTARALIWRVFKVEIARLILTADFLIIKGPTKDVFRSLLAWQSGEESCVPLTFSQAGVFSVSA